MKKLLIALLLVCVGLLIADPIPVGEGAETNTHLPMEPYYGYTYSQTIYTADEIGGAVNIENVAWHYNGYSAWTEDEVVIYMGHTTMTDFGDTYPNWIPVTELTEVYSGPFSVLDFDHWVTIDLASTFAYNGTDNLVIAFDANTAGYPTGGSSCEFYGTMTTLNRSTYFYSDSNNPDPADPPTGTYRENYDPQEAAKIGKTRERAAGVQTYIANIILNHDGVLPSGFVNGYVYDDATNAPIEGATVNVGSFVGMSDAMGFYEIEVLVEGEHAVSATHPDYLPADAGMVTVVFDQTVSVDIYMAINNLQGDQPGTAIAIDAMPFFDTGDTSVNFTNFIGNTSPDVFYTFTLTEELLMDIHCCGSGFDTYLRLYDDTMTQVFYNDDGCYGWPSGYSSASWIGNGNGVTVPAGTYYICLEGFSSNSGYYELTVEELLPPEYGHIDGTVTEDGTGNPIEGAIVNFAGMTATTDASGYYTIMDIETGIYNLTVTADGYNPGAVQDVEIFAEQTTTVDVALEMFQSVGDTWEDPIVVDAFPYMMSGDLTPYSDYTTTLALDGGRTGADVFYLVDLPNGATAEFHGCGSVFDSYMNLYDDAMNRVAYNDDGCSTWGTGSSMAPWIGEDEGTYNVILAPGTYYVVFEAYSSYTTVGYFEVHLDILPPPEFGSIDGHVTDETTSDPIEGASVTAGGITAFTDATGYYIIEGLIGGMYDVEFAADGYFGATVEDVTVVENSTTTVDAALLFNDLEGDTPATAFVVDAYPYFMTGDTNNYTNYIGNTSADVFFEITNTEETVMEIHCCGSEFDTYMHLYDADMVEFTYDDDGCSTWGAGSTMASWLGEDDGSYMVTVPAGTYYACIEGYGGNQGVYEAHINTVAFGTLEGVVTESYMGEPIAGATVTIGTLQGMTDATGFYSITGVMNGIYDVNCSAMGYIGQTVTDIEIMEDVTTTQDFVLDLDLEGPADLTATVNGYDVSLAWTAPYIPPANQIIYDDGVAENATAWYDPGNERAVWFTAGEDCVVTGGSMHIYDGTWPAGNALTPFTAMLWTYDSATGLPGEMLASVEVTPTDYEWVAFTFDTPVAVTGGEFCLGYAQGGTYPDCAPIGIDETLPTVNRSFEHYVSGAEDWAVSSYQDFMIRANLQDETGREMVVSYENPVIDIKRIKENTSSVSKYNVAVPQTNSRHSEVISPIMRDFTGEYNVYRDDALIATVTEVMYDDLALEAGIYEYYVKAVYDEGLSPETNHEVVELGMALVSVTPEEISETLDYGLTADHTITLTNSGDANFYWNGSINTRALLEMGESKPRTANSVSENAELGADAEMFEVPETREMWDMLYTGIWGADITSQAAFESDGVYVYTSVWNAATINKYDLEGNFIESFVIDGVTSIRDFAYDGQYFYGGAGANTLWQMDFNTQTLVSTINSPVAVRAIAYDDDMDGFWVNNWDTDITLIGRDGSIMDSFPCSTTYGSLYGMAYDNITDGGPYIYGYSQDGSGCVINQMSIATGADTGVFHDVLEDTGVAGDIAGGLFTSTDVIDGTFIIGAFNQGSYTATYYELCPSSSWLAIDPSNGTLAPGESVTITATFNAIELPGLTYFADIVFSDGEAAATVAADLTITGSIPTPEITVTPAEFDVIVSADGTLDQALTIGNTGDLALEYEAEIMYYEGRAVAEAYPQGADYWTGSFDGTAFTSTSAINLVDIEDGWAMFDVSGIPDGAVINSIDANVYISDTYYPWWSITPCTLDPLTTDAATLAGHIIGGEGTGVAYSFNNESSTFVPGWYTYPLGGTANADLEAALSDDWFACGFTSRDNSASFYVYIDGWNEANPPYLTIDYSIPINPWVTFDGDMTMGGMVEVGAGANAHNLHFDALGLMDGDVMMGEIVLSCNDLYTDEVIIPLTMTVGAPYMYGDVTGDEVVDAFDAANVLQYTVGMDPVGAPLPWTWQMMAGDVDGNGTPEAYDAALVLQYAVGMIDVFPVEARIDSPVAEVSMAVENGELVFSTTGNLYGFSVSAETELISFGEVELGYLYAANGNAVALANAEAISGEFLRVPFEKVSESGEFTLSMSVNGVNTDTIYNVEDLESAPPVNAVLGNYPNPFNPSTVIKLQVKEATPVTVNIYNVKGQLVKSLVNETLSMGVHEIEWNGTDLSNRSAATGVYFYNVKIGELNETHKMIMLK